MTKKNTVVTALESMLALQRWNFLPRVETWVEAENAAYVTHMGYAIGRACGLRTEELEVLLIRSLLKSLNKHYLTDISLPVREQLKAKNLKAWTGLVDAAAKKTARLFPGRLGDELYGYLTDKPCYQIAGRPARACIEVENVIKFAQLRVAYEECATNQQVYNAEYAPIIADLKKRMTQVPGYRKYAQVLAKHPEYFLRIKRLKHLRRWNRINRMVVSSVLGHVHLVAVLIVVLGRLSGDKTTKHFFYEALLKGLFHDVPESLTGDIITPVKAELARHDDGLLGEVETALTQDFTASAPPGVKEDLENYHLLREMDARYQFSVDSLVKSCDRLALVLECIYEKSTGMQTAEIAAAYGLGRRALMQSEWPAVREFMKQVSVRWRVARRI